jgi:hypothetical protein
MLGAGKERGWLLEDQLLNWGHCVPPIFPHFLGSELWLGLGSEEEVFQKLNCLYDFRNLCKLVSLLVQSSPTSFSSPSSFNMASTILPSFAAASLTTLPWPSVAGHF